MKRSIKILIYGLCSAVTSLIYIVLVPYATQYLGSSVLLGVCVIVWYNLGCLGMPRLILCAFENQQIDEVQASDRKERDIPYLQKGLRLASLLFLLSGLLLISFYFNFLIPKELEAQTAAAVEESYDKGYQAGIEETQAACDTAYEKGYSTGQNKGEKNGYTEGYLDGWNLGLDDGLTSSPTEHRLPSRDPIR